MDAGVTSMIDRETVRHAQNIACRITQTDDLAILCDRATMVSGGHGSLNTSDFDRAALIEANDLVACYTLSLKPRGHVEDTHDLRTRAGCNRR